MLRACCSGFLICEEWVTQFPWEGKAAGKAQITQLFSCHASLLWNGLFRHPQHLESLRNSFHRLHQLTFWGVTQSGERLMEWKDESPGKAAVIRGLRKHCLPEQCSLNLWHYHPAFLERLSCVQIQRLQTALWKDLWRGEEELLPVMSFRADS